MYNLCGNLRTCCITQRAPVGVNNNNVNIERCFMGKGAEGQSSDWSQEDVASYQLLFSNYMKYLLSGYWLKHQENIVYFGILLPESACPSFRHKKNPTSEKHTSGSRIMDISIIHTCIINACIRIEGHIYKGLHLEVRARRAPRLLVVL